MNYCKEIRLHLRKGVYHIEYEHKTTTQKIAVSEPKEALELMSALESNVDKWVD